jgi:hypothetical protein
LFGAIRAGQLIGGRGRGRFFQQRVQSAQQRFDLLRIKHGRGDQQCRRARRHQGWVGFNGRFQRGFIGQLAPRRRSRRIRPETQLQQRLLARLLICLGLHSHLAAP